MNLNFNLKSMEWNVFLYFSKENLFDTYSEFEFRRFKMTRFQFEICGMKRISLFLERKMNLNFLDLRWRVFNLKSWEIIETCFFTPERRKKSENKDIEFTREFEVKRTLLYFCCRVEAHRGRRGNKWVNLVKPYLAENVRKGVSSRNNRFRNVSLIDPPPAFCRRVQLYDPAAFKQTQCDRRSNYCTGCAR